MLNGQKRSYQALVPGQQYRDRRETERTSNRELCPSRRGRTIEPVSQNPTEGYYPETVRGCTLRCHELYKQKFSASLVEYT